MRPVSAILLTPIFALLLLAQAPIALGPTLLDTFSWYTATASGCTAGPRGMCVGNSALGDTNYFTGWFANANLLPVTTGLPIVGTLNDFNSRTCSGNVMVIQMAEFSWAARNASRVYEVNCLSSFNSGSNAPAGWFGHCTSGDNGTSNGCVWHTRSPFVRSGMLYLPVSRQAPAGSPNIRDATFIMSADGGATWKNPNTVAMGGPASATGDAPLCGAANGSAGSACTDSTYAASIMWPAVTGNMVAWQAVQYGQDWGGASPTTTMPPGVDDGCDPTTYTCFIGDPLDRSLMRVLNSDLPLLDKSKYQYYTCPAITDTYRCPGNAPASWTSTYADRTQIGPGIKSAIWSNPVAYIREFKSYLMLGGIDHGMIFATAPTIQGPWQYVVPKTFPGQGFGFTAVVLGIGHSVIGTDPPRIKLTTVSDRTDLDGNHQGSMRFDQWDLTLGRRFDGGQVSKLNILSRDFTSGSGLVFSDSHAPGDGAAQRVGLGL